MSEHTSRIAIVAVVAIGLLSVVGTAPATGVDSQGPNPCNPCGAQTNPCNPCGGATVDPERFVQPAGVKLASGRHSELVARGEALWNDSSLSTNGAACATCHQQYAQMKASFGQAYPHRVAMVEQLSGVTQVSAAEMVQFCMLQPMQAAPLDWSSRDLAALARYVERIQTGFDPAIVAQSGAPNPCNPCGAKTNPCNPCGAKNPCNPCNPCAGKNPCNPCGGKQNPCNPCNPCGGGR